MHCIWMLMITSQLAGYSLCFVSKAAWSDTNVNFPKWCKYGNTSQLIEHTTWQSRRVFHVIAQRFHFTHTYIPFILNLFIYIQNNDELWCFELIWFLYYSWSFKKHIGLYQPHDLHNVHRFTWIAFSNCLEHVEVKLPKKVNTYDVIP